MERAQFLVIWVIAGAPAKGELHPKPALLQRVQDCLEIGMRNPMRGDEACHVIKHD
jgi:hypothetical protein